MSTSGTERAFSEGAFRAQIRVEYKNFVHSDKLMFFNNMDFWFPVVLNDPKDIWTQGFENLKDQKPRKDQYADHHSKLYFSQTYGEYVTIIHQVIKMLGLERRANEACLKHRQFKLGEDPDIRDIAEIENVYLQIYTELRLKGYTHRDIAG